MPQQAAQAPHDPVTAALFADAPFAAAAKQQPWAAPAVPAAHSTQGVALNEQAALPARDKEPWKPPETADECAAALAPFFGPQARQGWPSADGATFVRQEPLEVLQAKWQAARPELLAAFRSRQRAARKKAGRQKPRKQ